MISPEENRGFMQYSHESVPKLLKEHALDKKQLNHAKIVGLSCSSSEVLNGVLDQIAQSIDNDQQGLLSLAIAFFSDKNTLDSWPLSQLLVKATFLKSLKLFDLERTTPENRSVLMDFLGELCQQNGNCLEELIIQWTDSTAEDGRKFSEALNPSK